MDGSLVDNGPQKPKHVDRLECLFVCVCRPAPTYGEILYMHSVLQRHYANFCSKLMLKSLCSRFLPDEKCIK